MGRGGYNGFFENPLALGKALSNNFWLWILPRSLDEISPLLDRMHTFSRGAEDELHQKRLKVARIFMLSILFINVVVMCFAVTWSFVVS